MLEWLTLVRVRLWSKQMPEHPPTAESMEVRTEEFAVVEAIATTMTVTVMMTKESTAVTTVDKNVW